MKKNKRFKLKLLMQLYGPMLIIYLLVLGTTFYTMNPYLIFTIFGIGLSLMVVSMLIISSNYAKQLSHLVQIADHIARGDISIEEDGWYSDLANNASELEQSMYLIIQKMKTYAYASAQMAAGNFNDNIPHFSDGDLIGKNLVSMKHSLEIMKKYTEKIQSLSSDHDFNLIDPEFQGIYQEIIQNIHDKMNQVNEKVSIYENAMDAIPYPLHILDLNSKWIFINKACDRLFQETNFAGPRESIYGTKYCKLNLTDCNQIGCNNSCSIYSLIANAQTTYDLEIQGKYYQKNVQYIENAAADQIGFVEITIDVTPIVSTNRYMEVEVLRLKNNLLLLAAGDLGFDLNIGEANQYTTDIFDSFNEICNSLSAVKLSIGYLIADADFLTQAIIKGNLESQADERRLKGSWQTIIRGMNNILTKVAQPLHEVSAVMNAVSNGNLSVMVSGLYEGDFEKLKQAVNHTVKQLNWVITEITSITKEIGNGNLNIDEAQAFDGDFVGISDALNLIIRTLNDLLYDINAAAELVSSGADQVAAGSQSLAQGTTEQASSLEELTATISEITDQTRDNAINANKARELTSSVRNTAAAGNEQMAEMQDSMIDINQSSNDISKIIKVIDDIAFQTNILALNAAVEAARAGQQGKGFAVVAEEVRTLAARSADAAKETTILIEGSINKVKVGTKIANETAEALTEIVSGIEKVADLVIDISSASNEQATAIAQINTGIEQVAQVVQQNSATSEESAATSEEMSSQAELLKESINQFQLRERSN